MAPRTILPLAALILCAGCTMAPEYTRPAAPVPAAWPQAAAGSVGPVASDVHWQDFFLDPNLRAIIASALAHNRDVRIAALNVEKAQALYRVQRSGLYPDVGVMASGDKYRKPEKMNSSGQATYVEQETVQFGVLSWELDFFGRIRSLKEEALNQYLATEQAHAASQVALVAAVAQSCGVCAADRECLQLAQGTFETQKAYLELISRSRDAGVASDLDVRQAESQMESARADVARYRGLVATDQNALELLVGAPVDPALLPRELDGAGSLKDVSAGLPSDVLLGRPDILMAEYQLKAASADIGAARAAFFPRVTLTAGVGTMSPDFANLFSSGTRTWSFAPQIVAPIFAGGSLRANLKASQVGREIAVAQYEKAIQTAFKEAADGLVQRGTYAEQLEAQRALVQALDSSHKLAKARYEAGLDGYLNVLVAQKALYAAQQGLVGTRLALRASRITLFKALGGRV